MYLQTPPANAETPSESVSASMLRLPAIVPTADPVLDAAVIQRISPAGFPENALGRLEELVLQLARIQSSGPLDFDLLAFDSPQAVVFAGDHGICDAGVSSFSQSTTRERVLQILRGEAPINTVAALQGFDLTVVDAGVASHLSEGPKATGLPVVPLLLRRNVRRLASLRVAGALCWVFGAAATLFGALPDLWWAPLSDVGVYAVPAGLFLSSLYALSLALDAADGDGDVRRGASKAKSGFALATSGWLAFLIVFVAVPIACAWSLVWSR